MEFKGTKGEWTSKNMRCGDYTIDSSIQDEIACVYSLCVSQEEAEANAKLISRAPNLLQSLIDTRSQLIDSGNYTEGSILIISIDEQIKLAI